MRARTICLWYEQSQKHIDLHFSIDSLTRFARGLLKFSPCKILAILHLWKKFVIFLNVSEIKFRSLRFAFICEVEIKWKQIFYFQFRCLSKVHQAKKNQPLKEWIKFKSLSSNWGKSKNEWWKNWKASSVYLLNNS